MSSFNINKIENEMKCFKPIKDLNNACKICGNNYFKKNVIINNITYIICYEYKEGYYFDDNDFNYKPCYSSCKKCNKSGNKTEHNCIECKEEYIYEFNFSIYKKCFIYNINELYSSINILIPSSIIKGINNFNNSKFTFSDSYYYNTNEISTNVIIKNESQINNRTELIQNKINNLFNQLNISNIDNGNDEKATINNISIIITSTKTQINNENN